MQINPLTDDNFGATITDFNCSKAHIRDGTAILEALFKYKFLVIKEQTISAEQYMNFMSLLGEPIPHVLQQFCLEDQRNILRISNFVREDGTPIGVREGGAYWHTDMSYLAANTVATSLYSQKIPKTEASETHFLDCETGYLRFRENKSHIWRNIYGAMLDINSARVVHRFGNRKTITQTDARVQKLTEQQLANFPEVLHPLVLLHPITGKKALYALSGTSIGIEGWTESASLEVLDELETFLFNTAPKYRHVYEIGDLVIWDNLLTLHSGIEIGAGRSFSDCRLLYRMNVNYLRRNSSW